MITIRIGSLIVRNMNHWIKAKSYCGLVINGTFNCFNSHVETWGVMLVNSNFIWGKGPGKNNIWKAAVIKFVNHKSGFGADFDGELRILGCNLRER